MAEEYQGHTKNVAQQGQSNVQGGRQQSSVGNAEYDLKTLLERFANGTSFDDTIEAVNQIYRDADNDRELRDWFKSLDTYIRKILKQEGYILDERATQEYNQIHEKGDYLLREKYKQHFDRVVDELKYVGQQFDRDPQNKALAHSLEKLFHDLGKDETGTQAFKPHLLKDLNDVILPSLFKEIGTYFTNLPCSWMSSVWHHIVPALTYLFHSRLHSNSSHRVLRSDDRCRC